MPQSPPANADQKEILQAFVDLSQTEAVSTGNQVTLVEEQLVRFQHAQDIFNERYDYWDKYIGSYHLERKLANGQFIMQPLTLADFQNFSAARGRLYLNNSYTPQRIPEFDQVGFGGSGTEQENETYILSRETRYRNYLLSGFASTTPLPGSTSYRLVGALTPTSTSITIERTDSNPITMPSAPNELLIYNTSNPNSGVIVEYLVATIDPLNDEATLTGLSFSGTFTSIPDNSPVVDSGPVFSNTDRTNQTTGAGNQSQLNAYMFGYLNQVTRWKTLIDAQVNQFTEEATNGEDAPDSAYVTSVQTTQSGLQAFITTPDYSNTGLTAQAVRNATRTGEIPTRVTWIDNRLIVGTKAYDSRYKYADRVYNLADGTYPLIKKFTEQKQQLSVRQAASNYRAAQLEGEIF